MKVANIYTYNFNQNQNFIKNFIYNLKILTLVQYKKKSMTYFTKVLFITNNELILLVRD